MVDGAKKFIGLFPEEHISIVVTSLIKAGKGLKKKNPNDLENWITRRLYRCAIRDFPFRDGPLHIGLQPEIVTDDTDDDKSSGQIDLLVSCGLGVEVYFAIEAKRLRVRLPGGRMNAGNDDYVNDGMMRFVSGQYAPLMKSGAMLGYVYDGDLKRARKGVAGYILKKVSELKLAPPKKLIRSKIMASRYVGETFHSLDSRNFTIYHIFLGV